jgi:hypothetical protein
MIKSCTNCGFAWETASKYTIKPIRKTEEKELKDDESDKELKEILKPKVIESVASHKEEE